MAESRKGKAAMSEEEAKLPEKLTPGGGAGGEGLELKEEVKLVEELPQELPKPAPIPGFAPGGVQSTGPAAIGTRHMILIDQIIAWSIANPGKPWSVCATQLGVNKLFISKMVNSDTFRERYLQVRDRTLEEVGILSLKDKIAAAADVGIERIAEKLAVTESMSDLVDATEMLLNRTYGVVPQGGGASPAMSLSITNAILDGRSQMMTPKPPIEHEKS